MKLPTKKQKCFSTRPLPLFKVVFWFTRISHNTFHSRATLFRGEGGVKLAMCSSRKYPYLYHGGFLLLYPHPLGMSIPRGDCKTPPHPLGFP